MRRGAWCCCCCCWWTHESANEVFVDKVRCVWKGAGAVRLRGPQTTCRWPFIDSLSAVSSEPLTSSSSSAYRQRQRETDRGSWNEWEDCDSSDTELPPAECLLRQKKMQSLLFARLHVLACADHSRTHLWCTGSTPQSFTDRIQTIQWTDIFIFKENLCYSWLKFCTQHTTPKWHWKTNPSIWTLSSDKNCRNRYRLLLSVRKTRVFLTLRVRKKGKL